MGVRKARSAPSNEFKSSTKVVKGEQYPLKHIQRDGRPPRPPRSMARNFLSTREWPCTTFPTALSSYIAQERVRKDIRPLSKLFSKAEPLPFQNAINNNLVYSSCLKHANEMLLGDPRLADHRPANAKLPFPHRHSSITRPCAARAFKRQAACRYMHSSTRQAQKALTHRVDAPSR